LSWWRPTFGQYNHTLLSFVILQWLFNFIHLVPAITSEP
jgi:hypothetical protein